jgi:hypothetical protein
MNRFLLRLSMAAAITLAVSAAGESVKAQQADQDSNPSTPQKAQPPAVPPQHANEAQMPASGETTTQEAQAFTGRIVKENGNLVLKDVVTKVVYKLSDTSKARSYSGRQVKITGKLEMNTNTIEVESIEPIRE